MQVTIKGRPGEGKTMLVLVLARALYELGVEAKITDGDAFIDGNAARLQRDLEAEAPHIAETLRRAKISIVTEIA